MDGNFNNHSYLRERNILLYVDDRLLHTATQQKSHAFGIGGVSSSHSVMQLNTVLLDYAHSSEQADLTRHDPLQRRFEVVARTTPCAIAVRFNGRFLTYGELDEQADALALHLQAAGLAPCSFCVVDLAPSLAQVRAVLAVLKAGAACLQVDARIAPGAKAAVLAALAPSFCVTRDPAQASAATAGMHTVFCDEDADDLPYGWADEMPIGARTPACAYATLTPRGDLCIVVRTHRALNELLGRARPAGPRPFAGPDPGGLWRSLASGAPLTIDAPVAPR